MCYFRISLQDSKIGVTKYFLQKGAFVPDKIENHRLGAVRPVPHFQGSPLRASSTGDRFPCPDKTLPGLFLLSRSYLPFQLTAISPSSAVGTLPLDLNQLHHSGLHTSYLTNQSPGLQPLEMSAHNPPPPHGGVLRVQEMLQVRHLTGPGIESMILNVR